MADEGFNSQQPAGDLFNTTVGIEKLVSAIVPICDSNLPTPQLDLTKCPYLGLNAVTIIAALLEKSRQRGRQIKVILPETIYPQEMSEYYDWVGLYHFVNGSKSPDPSDPRNPTVPLSLLTHASYSDADPVINLVRRQVQLDEEKEEYLRICVHEIIQNVQDHASSPIGAMLGAWFEALSPDILQVAVVDCGIGIAASLKTRYPELADAKDALRRVIDGGVSAKSRPNNMGCGISNLGAIVVNQLRGDLTIVSGEGVARSNAGGWDITKDLKRAFPGTGVFLAIPFK